MKSESEIEQEKIDLWQTDKQMGWAKVEAAKQVEGFAGRNPAADREKAKALKKHLQRTTLSLDHDGGVVHGSPAYLLAKSDRYLTDTKRSYADNAKDPDRDPFQDSKRAKQLKLKLQASKLDLGSGFGGASANPYETEKQAGWKKVETAVATEVNAGRNPMANYIKAKELKKHLQRTTVQLGFDDRYM